MKRLMQVTEVEGEGLVALLGKNVLLMCANYFYSGTLTGVNETVVELSGASIVYETGPWPIVAFKDAQSLGSSPHYVMIGAVESFREVA